MGTLSSTSYGKSDIRLTKVVRNGQRHELYEITANVQLEGDFAAAYTQGDNRNCVATDTMKNFVYVKAKEWRLNGLEGFAVLLAEDLVGTYPQVSRAIVELEQATWRRIDVNGSPHDHAFVDGGRQKRIARSVSIRGTAPPTRLIAGVRDLVVLKTTASEWRDFHRDRYRTLPDTRDRILATSIDAEWLFADGFVETNFDAHYEAITSAILTTFATQHSLGAQQTLKAMGDAALAACASITSISMTLPNLHRIPFNFEPFGLEFEYDVFVATDAPHGLIKGTITREA